jgi:translocation and assembly module TamB
MKRGWKYTLITIGSLVGLVLLMLAFTQTSLFRNWLKDQIVNRAGKRLNGQLSIEGLEGNLFSHIQLKGILVQAKGDTVLYIPMLSLDLSPSRLLHKELRIDSITIDAPYTKMVQATDSSWNVSDLVRNDSLAPSDTIKRTDTSGFRIELNDFILRDGSVRLTPLDSSVRAFVSKIGLRFTAAYSDTAQQLDLKNLSFSLENPPFNLEKLSLTASRRGSKITLGSLVVKTARNQMGGQGTYVASDSAVSSGNLASKPFDFSELNAFIPSLALYGNPTFEVETELERDSLAVRLGIIEAPQRIDLRLDVAGVSKTLSAATRDQARYYANVKLTKFDPASWLGDSTLAYQASGTVTVAGSGILPNTADFRLTADLTDLRALGRSIGTLTGSMSYTKGNLDGELKAVGDFGNLNSTFAAQDITNAQEFRATVEASHLNLAPLMQDDSLKSDLNLTAQVQGSGFDTTRLTGSGTVAVSPSRMFNTTLDTAFARGSFTANSYQIDTFHIATPIGRADAAGKGAIGGSNEFKFWAQLKNLEPLKGMIKADSLAGNGTLSGTAKGTFDSLQVSGDLEFHKLQYNAFGVDQLKGELSALKRKDDVVGSARFSALRLGTVGMMLDSVNVSSKFTRKTADVTMDAMYRPGIDGHIETKINFDSTSTIAIPNLALNFKDQHWKGGSPQTRITMQGDDYRVDSLRLTSPFDSGGGVQSMSVDGLFSMTGTENLNLTLDRLDLNKLTTPFGLSSMIGGRLTGDVELTGTASAPVMVGKMTIDSGQVNQFSYRALHSDFNYGAEKLTWNLSLVPLTGDSLSIDGFVPITLSLATGEGKLHRDRPLEVTAKSTGLPLAVIQASGQPIKQVQGFITADLNVSNTIESPTASGSVGLRDGKVSVPKYGIEYSDILTSLSIQDATLTLDTLQAKRDQGYLTGSGSLQFEKSLLTGTIKTLQFDFIANRFYALHHKDYQIQISGNPNLTGSGRQQVFGGNITILRSSFFLPALMEQAAAAQAAADRSMPLLVKATLNPDTLADSSSAAQARAQLALDTSQSDWYKNLRGQFKITIPRNTWLRSPDMNLEIGEGDIDLVKNGPDFEIFGPLKILRGQYNLYGKRFTILQGNLMFQGGREYNPEISMQAQYVFRTADREKRTLKLDVSGKAFSPVLAFTLDDNAIEERDAIAYVMYGRSMDELTSGQQSSAGAAQGELAKGAAANMLSNQLSQTLGGKLGLDVVDISSQGSLASATVTVGKYLTNDLFMSYQRSLGQSQDQNAAAQIVTLEYELSKHFFLQLIQGDEKSSGFDFIYKYQH